MANKERKLTCIVCPKGCELTVVFNDKGSVESVSGYTCPRGKDYATAECTAPVRTVTSTVKCEDGAVVSVKTSKPIPKEKIFDVMAQINAVRVKNDVVIGDVVIKGVAGTDSDIIVTSNR